MSKIIKHLRDADLICERDNVRTTEHPAKCLLLTPKGLKLAQTMFSLSQDTTFNWSGKIEHAKIKK